MGVNLKQGYFGTPPIVRDGLVLQLDAANTKSYVSGSTTWNDLSGRSNSGSLISAGYNRYNGGAVTFAGSAASYATIANDGSLTFGSGDFTIECWFNTNGVSQTTNATLICIGAVGGVTNWQLSFTSNNLVFFYSNLSFLNSSFNAIDSAGWNHVVVRRTFGDRTRIYINGLLDVSSTGGASVNFSQTGELKLSRNRGSTVGYNGSISIVRLYNRDITQQGIAQNYNALKARFGLS